MGEGERTLLPLVEVIIFTFVLFGISERKVNDKYLLLFGSIEK
jgi:hypothetical protein